MFYVDMFNYEQDVFNKLKNIDLHAQQVSSNYYSFIPFSDDTSREYSLYGSKLEKRIKNLNRMNESISNDIRDISKRIKDIASSGKPSKTEGEFRNIKASLYKIQLDIEKTTADLEGKKEKGRMDDIKFNREMDMLDAKIAASGGLPNSPMGDHISTTDKFMANTMSGGVDSFIKNRSNPFSSLGNTTPPAVMSTGNIDTSNVTPFNNERTPSGEIKELPNNSNMNETNVTRIENKVQEEPVVVEEVINDPSAKSIVNAQGHVVNIYDNGNAPTDFKEPEPGFTNAKLALNNILIKKNPNAKEFFKYNEKERMGWLVWVDTETREELEGTHIDLKLLYPFEIDTTNNVVNTRLEKTYPLMYTDKDVPEQVKRDFAHMETIAKNRQQHETQEEQ